MRLRRNIRFHGIGRPKLRQTWNKYNLFNLAKYDPTFKIDPGVDTFFQQKWKAKAMMRAYHGEHVTETKWARAFSRRLLSVVPMTPSYMARTDGSRHAAGRGSGLEMRTDQEIGHERANIINQGYDMLTGKGAPQRRTTPYMCMTFAPLERRLDTAIFRSLFASSARQARMFVVHGKVKVNGIKIHRPNYLLNPGDMFQVDPISVMYATGIHKGQNVMPAGGGESDKDKKKKARAQREQAAMIARSLPKPPPSSPTPSPSSSSKSQAEDKPNTTIAKREVTIKSTQARLKDLITSAKSLMALENSTMNSTKKRRIRAFRDEIKTLLSKLQRQATKTPSPPTDKEDATMPLTKSALLDRSVSTMSDANLVRELSRILDSGITVTDVKEGKTPEAITAAAAKAADEKQAAAAPTTPEDDAVEPKTLDSHRKLTRANLTPHQRNILQGILEDESDNPSDSKMPYKTPWRPRPWIAPFAFIPRYLEVNHKICSAVYLRHPVARPGSAEVPTPFPDWIGGLSFNYYLRRR